MNPETTKAANELCEKVAKTIHDLQCGWEGYHNTACDNEIKLIKETLLTTLNLEQLLADKAMLERYKAWHKEISEQLNFKEGKIKELLADKVSNQRLFQLLKADYDHEWPYEDENTKAHRELMLAAISAAMEKGVGK